MTLLDQPTPSNRSTVPTGDVRIESATYDVMDWLEPMLALQKAHYCDKIGFSESFVTDRREEMRSVLVRFNPRIDRLWLALDEQNRLLGCMMVEGRRTTPEVAEIHYYIVAASQQGQGLGKKLLQLAVDFARQAPQVMVLELWTLDSFRAAIRRYEQAGFVRTETYDTRAWAFQDRMCRYALDVCSPAAQDCDSQNPSAAELMQ